MQVMQIHFDQIIQTASAEEDVRHQVMSQDAPSEVLTVERCSQWAAAWDIVKKA